MRRAGRGKLVTRKMHTGIDNTKFPKRRFLKKKKKKKTPE
jgi:hypothetical protein